MDNEKQNNPAQDGINGALEDARKVRVAGEMIDDFKEFVLEQMVDLELDAVDSDVRILEIIKDGMQLFYDFKKEELE